MIFNNDRVQYSKEKDKFIYFEFIKVKNIQALINMEKTPIKLLKKVKDDADFFVKKKMSFVASIKKEVAKAFVLYEEGVDKYLLVTSVLNNNLKYTVKRFDNLKSFRKAFQALNNIDGNAGFSKAIKKEEDEDQYVNELLGDIHGISNFSDDNGLNLTKKLLDGQATKGFDFDLVSYIASTDEYLIFEFLKRENKYISNITAHPMRYCWKKEGESDNKKKFTSLWNAKNYFKGKLFLVSYSDDPNEDISLIEVVKMDDEKGILKEKKYCMSREEFKNWLQVVNTYNKKSTDYLTGHKMVEYDEEFLKNFDKNKSKYGKEFLEKTS